MWACAEREPPWPGCVRRGASPGDGQEGAEAEEGCPWRQGLRWAPWAQHMQVLGLKPCRQVLRAKTCMERMTGDGAEVQGGLERRLEPVSGGTGRAGRGSPPKVWTVAPIPRWSGL